MIPDFEYLNAHIQEFLQKNQPDAYNLNDREYKLPLSDALFCALDTPRNRKFFAAIQKAIIDLQQKTNEIHLVYAGSGTGILGIFALALGAKSALFLEHNPYSLNFSKQLVEEMGFGNQVEFLEADATKVELEKPFDLLISETLTSGFVREEFPLIINHLRQFAKAHAVILPQEFRVRLIEKAPLIRSVPKEFSGNYKPVEKRDEVVAEQNFNFISAEGFKPQQIVLKHARTKKLTWRTTAVLYSGITLSSGECVSFLNEMTQHVADFEHPLFTLP